MKQNQFDIAVIGGGITAAAAAANLATSASVLVLERESQPGYHATGRSAAVFSQTLGSATIRSLSQASDAFFHTPPPAFSGTPLVSPRGKLYIASANQLDALEGLANAPGVAEFARYANPDEIAALARGLRPGHVAAALYEPQAQDLDVHALLQGYLRWLRGNGGRLVIDAGVVALQRIDGQWVIHTAAGTFRAKILVNAAGAWVDEVAGLAGARPSGIRPLRRTAFMVDAPPTLDITHWPMTDDIASQFYFKPDAGRLLVSPADETVSVPCDAWPDDMDIAIAVDRIEQATTLSITHVQQKWAGLRSFVADRNPVIGYDPLIEDFFWIAALGGSGIQTAPAVGRLAAARIKHQPVPDDLQQRGLDERALSPQRLVV